MQKKKQKCWAAKKKNTFVSQPQGTGECKGWPQQKRGGARARRQKVRGEGTYDRLPGRQEAWDHEDRCACNEHKIREADRQRDKPAH